jgi:hypothetical protein
MPKHMNVPWVGLMIGIIIGKYEREDEKIVMTHQ